MEKNIFEGAKFGDKFVTREGKLALFINFEDLAPYVYLFIEGEFKLLYTYDGVCKLNTNGKYDIVSKYHEEIDEEKLDKLAKVHMLKTYGSDLNCLSQCSQSTIDKFDSYKTGYRKAKEE